MSLTSINGTAMEIAMRAMYADPTVLWFHARLGI